MRMRIPGLWMILTGIALAQDAKNDPPGAEAQARIEKDIRELFKEEYAGKTAVAQRKLAAILLKQGRETKDDPAVQYVLYRESADLAARGGDLGTLLAGVQALLGGWKLEPAALKGSLLQKAEPAVLGADDQKKLADALLQVSQEALEEDQFDLASKTASSSLALAKKAKDLALTTRADGMARAVQEWKAGFEKSRSAEGTLGTAPDYAAAHQARGEYLSFLKGRWEEGLVHLSKGEDGAAKTLAAKELAATQAGAAVPLEVADGWWDLSASEKSSLRKSRIRSHARSLYEQALPGASGLTRMRIDARMAEGGTGLSPWETPASATREGLVAWWKFDEGKGASAADSSGSGNDGTLENVAWVAGKKGTALRFNGATSHMTSKAANLPATHAPQTISWWHFRPNARTQGNMIIVGNESPPSAIQIGMAKEKVGIWKLGGEPVRTAPDLQVSAWTHGAYTFDGKTHALYINGRLEASCDVPPQVGMPTRCELGRWWGSVGSGYYDGILDEIRIYNRALSPSEIAALASGRD